MIVVRPFGHATPFGGGHGAPGSASNRLLFEKYLLTDVIPAVDVSIDRRTASLTVSRLESGGDGYKRSRRCNAPMAPGSAAAASASARMRSWYSAVKVRRLAP